MSGKQYEVLSICNALVDILYEVPDSVLKSHQLTPGIMHLVDSDTQAKLLKSLSGQHPQIELGGSALNATRTLAQLGLQTYFVGMVGHDELGGKILDRLDELGIDARIEKIKEPTGSCVVLITPDGERTMVTSLGASCHYDENIVPHDKIGKSNILFFTGYQWSTPHQRNAIEKAVETARRSNTLVAFDVADPFMVKQWGQDFRDFIATKADIVFSNAQETAELYPGMKVEEIGAKLAKAGKTVVIKLGAEGAYVAGPSLSEKISAFKVKVVDTTAAGDMFAAGFLYGLSQKWDLRKSTQAAAYIASDVISRIGARVSELALKHTREGSWERTLSL